jgi:hypothetical protein
VSTIIVLPRRDTLPIFFLKNGLKNPRDFTVSKGHEYPLVTYNKYFIFNLETFIINVVFSIREQKEPLFISQTVGDCFFPLICPRGMKTKLFLGNNLEWPTLTINYLFILFFCKNFFWAHYSYESQINLTKFHRFWSMTSNPKSPNTCNFKGCPKFETPKFQQWQIFISHLNVRFFPLKHLG